MSFFSVHRPPQNIPLSLGYWWIKPYRYSKTAGLDMNCPVLPVSSFRWNLSRLVWEDVEKTPSQEPTKRTKEKITLKTRFGWNIRCRGVFHSQWRGGLLTHQILRWIVTLTAYGNKSLLFPITVRHHSAPSKLTSLWFLKWCYCITASRYSMPATKAWLDSVRWLRGLLSAIFGWSWIVFHAFPL